jgi:hypothetical protein
MGKPYSSDLRQRFVAALDEGMSASAAGRRMRIARSTAVRWAAIWQKEGRAEALPMGGDRRSEALEAHAETILGWVAETPDLFLNEIAARLAAEGIESFGERDQPPSGPSRDHAQKKDTGRGGTVAGRHRQSPGRVARQDARP